MSIVNESRLSVIRPTGPISRMVHAWQKRTAPTLPARQPDLGGRPGAARRAGLRNNCPNTSSHYMVSTTYPVQNHGFFDLFAHRTSGRAGTDRREAGAQHGPFSSGGIVHRPSLTPAHRRCQRPPAALSSRTLRSEARGPAGPDGSGGTSRESLYRMMFWIFRIRETRSSLASVRSL